jgi:hypothetical protein
VLLSEPLKKFLQERADRFFYGERYDLRHGLLDFGRTLSATTALDPLLNALSERLRQVLDVEKVAIFIEDETVPEHYRLAKSIGVSENYKIPNDFRQMIRQKSAEKGIVRADEFELFDEEIIETSRRREKRNYRKNREIQLRQKRQKYSPAGTALFRAVRRARQNGRRHRFGRASDGSLFRAKIWKFCKPFPVYVGVAIENSLLYQEQDKRAEELALAERI